MKKLNSTEQALLDFIIEYKRSHDGNSPSTREMADSLGYSSTSTAHIHLGRLADKGWISLGNNKKRQIQVVGGIWMTASEMVDVINGVSQLDNDAKSHINTPWFVIDESGSNPVWDEIGKVRRQE